MGSSEEINVLLLGETGVGKSTFINSFANYIQYETLEEAHESEEICLVPTRFSIQDENFQDRIIEVEKVDKNEDKVLGNSSTQACRTYCFPLDSGKNLRIIDTPGIGDARGIEQDKINFENILAHLSRFKHLHAICFLLKPNVTVINPYFKFCLMHLFSRLEKSAANNIVFIFTCSRSTFYRPGDTLPLLRIVLDEIANRKPHVKIAADQNNIFCFDNEAFKFLIAVKRGIKFGEKEFREFSSSWNTSSESSKNLIKYIAGDRQNRGLRPHEIQNTLSVNDARRVIIDLSKPLADITDNIHDNLQVLERHRKTLQQENMSIADLQNNLFVPAVTVECHELQQPVTVCTASKCSETVVVGGIDKYHYKQRCHNPCYLKNVPTEIIGSPELRRCAAMRGTTCKECGCDFSTHQHILYETEVKSVKLEDATVKTRICSRRDEIDAKTVIIRKLEIRSNDYNEEKAEISKSMAVFACFLQQNSISPYNDAYSDYIEYLIEREKGLGVNKNKDLLKRYEELQKQYMEEKTVLEQACLNAEQTGSSIQLLTPEIIYTTIQSLYGLKHSGSKIKEFHKKNMELRKKEHEHSIDFHVPKKNKKSQKKVRSITPDKVEEKEDFSKIIVKLLEEDNFEDVRLKIRDMKFKNKDDDYTEDMKQRLWEVMCEIYEKSKKDPEEFNKRDTGKQRSNRGRHRNKKNKDFQNKGTNQKDSTTENLNNYTEQKKYSKQRGNRNQSSYQDHRNYNSERYQNQPPKNQSHNQKTYLSNQSQKYQNQNFDQQQYNSRGQDFHNQRPQFSDQNQQYFHNQQHMSNQQQYHNQQQHHNLQFPNSQHQQFPNQEQQFPNQQQYHNQQQYLNQQFPNPQYQQFPNQEQQVLNRQQFPNQQQFPDHQQSSIPQQKMYNQQHQYPSQQEFFTPENATNQQQFSKQNPPVFQFLTKDQKMYGNQSQNSMQNQYDYQSNSEDYLDDRRNQYLKLRSEKNLSKNEKTDTFMKNNLYKEEQKKISSESSEDESDTDESNSSSEGNDDEDKIVKLIADIMKTTKEAQGGSNAQISERPLQSQNSERQFEGQNSETLHFQDQNPQRQLHSRDTRRYYQGNDSAGHSRGGYSEENPKKENKSRIASLLSFLR